MADTWRCPRCVVSYHNTERPHAQRYKCEVPGCKVVYQQKVPKNGPVIMLAKSGQSTGNGKTRQGVYHG